jgi:transcriptional regulator with XRE-family HTH domain
VGWKSSGICLWADIYLPSTDYGLCVGVQLSAISMASSVTKRLEMERRKQKMSRNEVARRSGLSMSMVSRVERGLRQPTLVTLYQMCHALGTELEDILRLAKRDAARARSKSALRGQSETEVRRRSNRT